VNLEVPPLAVSPSGSPLMDPEKAARIVATGLMDPGARARAEDLARQAGGGRSAVFDVQAGWLLVPATEASAPP
jgi:hypothetical protein